MYKFWAGVYCLKKTKFYISIIKSFFTFLQDKKSSFVYNSDVFCIYKIVIFCQFAKGIIFICPSVKSDIDYRHQFFMLLVVAQQVTETRVLGTRIYRMEKWVESKLNKVFLHCWHKFLPCLMIFQSGALQRCHRGTLKNYHHTW